MPEHVPDVYPASDDDVELYNKELDRTMTVPRSAVDGWRTAGWVEASRSKAAKKDGE